MDAVNNDLEQNRLTFKNKLIKNLKDDKPFACVLNHMSYSLSTSYDLKARDYFMSHCLQKFRLVYGNADYTEVNESQSYHNSISEEVNSTEEKSCNDETNSEEKKENFEANEQFITAVNNFITRSPRSVGPSNSGRMVL